jgi:predicted transcriptional regulator
LQALQLALGPPAEIIAERPSTRKPPAENHVMAEVVELLARHPATFAEIAEYVNGERKTIASVLQALAKDGVIEGREHEGKQFYAAVHSH